MAFLSQLVTHTTMGWFGSMLLIFRIMQMEQNTLIQQLMAMLKTFLMDRLRDCQSIFCLCESIPLLLTLTKNFTSKTVPWLTVDRCMQHGVVGLLQIM